MSANASENVIIMDNLLYRQCKCFYLQFWCGFRKKKNSFKIRRILVRRFRDFVSLMSLVVQRKGIAVDSFLVYCLWGCRERALPWTAIQSVVFGGVEKEHCHGHLFVSHQPQNKNVGIWKEPPTVHLQVSSPVTHFCKRGPI